MTKSKPCQQCGKPNERGGKTRLCPACMAKNKADYNRRYFRAWYQKNTPRCRERTKAYREANHERALKYERQWRKNNPERIRAYKEAHREKRRAYNTEYQRKRRGRLNEQAES